MLLAYSFRIWWWLQEEASFALIANNKNAFKNSKWKLKIKSKGKNKRKERDVSKQRKSRGKKYFSKS